MMYMVTRSSAIVDYMLLIKHSKVDIMLYFVVPFKVYILCNTRGSVSSHKGDPIKICRSDGLVPAKSIQTPGSF